MMASILGCHKNLMKYPLYLTDNDLNDERIIVKKMMNTTYYHILEGHKSGNRLWFSYLGLEPKAFVDYFFQ